MFFRAWLDVQEGGMTGLEDRSARTHQHLIHKQILFHCLFFIEKHCVVVGFPLKLICFIGCSLHLMLFDGYIVENNIFVFI